MHRHSISAGDEVRQAREDVGLSREGLAYKAGIALSTVERIERGDVKPRRATLAMIRQVLEHEPPTKAAA